MNKKLVVRTVVGLFAVALLYVGYQWLKGWTMDPDTGTTDTTDMIVAVEDVDGGSRIVVFDSNNKKTEVPGSVAGSSDVDPVWRPDGQRVFFSSNRNGTSNNIFRWNIANNAIEQKSQGSRSAGSPYFGPPDWPNVEDSGLITVGGAVFDFNQRDKRTRQILPPLQFDNTGDSEAGQLGSVYERMGTSFKSAKWGKGRKVMYTVMRREDDEVFLVNYMEPFAGIPVGPVPLFAGQSIQFDVANDGTAVVSIQGFEYVDPTQVPQELMINGRATKPWRNGLFAVTVMEDGKLAPLLPLFTDQPDLGVAPQLLTPELRTERAVPAGVNGMLVQAVAPGSAAQRLQIKAGDVVMSVNGVTVATVESFFTELSKIRLGAAAQFGFWSAAEKSSKSGQYTFGNESSMALRDPCVSPDSKTVAVVVGMVTDKYTFEPQELVLVPLGPSGLNAGKRLVGGRVFEPTWHPSGNKLVFAMVGEGGDSQIFVVGSDGSGQKNVSGPGEYSSPKFSPFTKKS